MTESHSEPFARQLVWSVWLVCTIMVFRFVAQFGSHVPVYDEYLNLPLLTGEGLTPSFLWAAHNEHRIPLPKLMYAAAFHLSGGSLKAPVYWNATLVILSGAILLAMVIRLRGGASYSDALIPLLVVNPGQWENLLWGFQLQFTGGLLLTSCVLACLLLSHGRAISRTTIIGVFLTSIATAMCGANGVALLPAIIVWQTAAVWINHREGRGILVPAIAALLTGIFLIGYFFKLTALGTSTNPRSLTSSFSAFAQFLAASFGPAGNLLGDVRPGFPILGCALSIPIIAAAIICVTIFRDPERRPLALGMLAALAALLSLAVGLSLGRSGSVSLGSVNRYVTLAVPLAVWLYAATMILHSPRWSRLQGYLFAGAVVACLWTNVKTGYDRGRSRAETLAAAYYDLKFGVPDEFFADRYRFWIFPAKRDDLLFFLDKFREHKIGVFRDLAAMPPLDSQPMSIRLAARDYVSITDTQLITTNPIGDAELILSESPREIYAVELTYTLTSPRGEVVQNRISIWPEGERGTSRRSLTNPFITTGKPERIKLLLDRPVTKLRIELMHHEPGVTLTIHSLSELTRTAAP